MAERKNAGERGFSWLKARITKLQQQNPELRQRWEDQVGSHVRGAFTDKRRRTEGPTWATLCRMAEVAGMEIHDFLFGDDERMLSGTAIENADHLRYAIELAIQMIEAAGGRPDADTITDMVSLLYSDPLETAEQRKNAREQYQKVVPLILRQGRR